MAEKAYLEEQLKSRGSKRSSKEAGCSQQRQISDNRKDGSVSFLDASQSLCSGEGSKRHVDESFAQKEGEGLDNSRIVRTTVVKREINILDDLEKEFNKQKLGEKEKGSWPPMMAVKETERMSWGGKEEERQSRNTSSSSDSKSDIEVRPDENGLFLSFCLLATCMHACYMYMYMYLVYCTTHRHSTRHTAFTCTSLCIAQG